MADPPIAGARSALPQRRTSARYLSAFSASLKTRLLGGEHILLYGPRGAGKSSLLAALCRQLSAQAVPCALAAQTTGLADVVDACSKAYPRTPIDGLQRRALATRLRLTAEHARGVILLDHVHELTSAMIGYLRLLRGGVIAALLCVDVDAAFEQQRLLAWRRHALCVRMPPMPNRELRRLLLWTCAGQGFDPPAPEVLRRLTAAARGRVGWITECGRRWPQPQYWQDGWLHVSALSLDSEIALRQTRGPRLRRSRSWQDGPAGGAT